MARTLTPALLLCVLALAVAGCGGEDTDTEVPTIDYSSLAEPPPRGASPVLKELYRQFQPPQPDPRMRKRSARAIKAGERACRGKRPIEVRDELIAESDLLEDQKKAVAQIRKFEKSATSSFVAGQLAALVYEGTLPEGIVARSGYKGCIYAMSLRYKRQLARQ